MRRGSVLQTGKKERKRIRKGAQKGGTDIKQGEELRRHRLNNEGKGGGDQFRLSLLESKIKKKEKW